VVGSVAGGGEGAQAAVLLAILRQDDRRTELVGGRSLWSPWEWVTRTVPMPPRSAPAARIASRWPASSEPGSMATQGSAP